MNTTNKMIFRFVEDYCIPAIRKFFTPNSQRKNATKQSKQYGKKNRALNSLITPISTDRMKIDATTSKFTFLSDPLQVDKWAYKVARHQQFAKHCGSPKVSRRVGGRPPPVEKRINLLS